MYLMETLTFTDTLIVVTVLPGWLSNYLATGKDSHTEVLRPVFLEISRSKHTAVFRSFF